MANKGSRGYEAAWRMHARLLGPILRQWERERRAKQVQKARRMAHAAASVRPATDSVGHAEASPGTVVHPIQCSVQALRPVALQSASGRASGSTDGPGDGLGLPGAS